MSSPEDTPDNTPDNTPAINPLPPAVAALFLVLLGIEVVFVRTMAKVRSTMAIVSQATARPLRETTFSRNSALMQRGVYHSFTFQNAGLTGPDLWSPG